MWPSNRKRRRSSSSIWFSFFFFHFVLTTHLVRADRLGIHNSSETTRAETETGREHHGRKNNYGIHSCDWHQHSKHLTRAPPANMSSSTIKQVQLFLFFFNVFFFRIFNVYTLRHCLFQPVQHKISEKCLFS